MKINTYKYIGIVSFILLIISCSTKKDRFVNRTFHAKTAKYNILYNGDVALETGLKDLGTTYKDNFWDVLPVEYLQDSEEDMLPGEEKNPNFERAEDKAIKAIQKHSMNIGGSEKNSQMDEAYILLGKARYYDNRFIPALEAFNYVLYKYPNSDKIYEAKVWREKINIRLDNDQVAADNLKRLLKDQKIEGQDLANASAMLAQAYMNLGVKDTALAVLKIAKEKTKINDQKARYTFITGQLYEDLKYPDSAAMAYNEVIEMKRKSPRKYTIQAHAKLAQQFDYEKGDTLVFLEKFNELLEDRENRPFLDVINHQIALFYDKQKNDNQAVKYYNKSLRKQTADKYLTAFNYRNIAEINFYNAEYLKAGKYYDSTLTKLNDRTREYRAIAKKRLNLNDVIKYEGIVTTNDSILYVVSLSEEERNTYYSSYIEKLKEQDLLKQKEMERLALIEENKANNGGKIPGGKGNNMIISEDDISVSSKAKFAPPSIGGNDNQASSFYFYSQTNLAFGKSEFRKKWGKRELKDNWRFSKLSNNNSNTEEEENNIAEKTEEEVVENPAYKVDFYTSQLPSDQKVLDSLKIDRDFADYQLGSIYKEKFKEYQLAAAKFEKLLGNQPEERLILPSKYNLFKIYQILGSPKANDMKQQIIAEYPDSRYAQIIQNPNQENEDNQSPEAIYAKLYKEFENGEIRESYVKVNEFIDLYTGDEMAPKFELLKAQIAARLKGLDEYKKTLNFVALNYPNAKEGKEAESILSKNIPNLEKLEFKQETTGSWKIVFPKDYMSVAQIEALYVKLDKFIKDRSDVLVKRSNDVYNEKTNFIVLHGFQSKESAQSTLFLLKDYKDYKVNDEAYIISSDNYMIVQIKKNWDKFIALIK
ncbi:gliding motility protein [uncultured Flavobacterium sp.]|uniref:type IX secretion system periplasmic lipoprotein PorW/SprE n=1 Tax=uncultured Flavobacterium sp. TaxID=165435 RepID=UPI0030C7A289